MLKWVPTQPMSHGDNLFLKKWENSDSERQKQRRAAVSLLVIFLIVIICVIPSVHVNLYGVIFRFPNQTHNATVTTSTPATTTTTTTTTTTIHIQLVPCVAIATGSLTKATLGSKESLIDLIDSIDYSVPFPTITEDELNAHLPLVFQHPSNASPTSSHVHNYRTSHGLSFNSLSNPVFPEPDAQSSHALPSPSQA